MSPSAVVPWPDLTKKLPCPSALPTLRVGPRVRVQVSMKHGGQEWFREGVGDKAGVDTQPSNDMAAERLRSPL